MGWIQQTKQASRKSGGPQYYLQGIGDTFKTLLATRGACEVWLGTPYGIVESGLVAVAADRVLADGKLRRGNVGHDRIQRQRAALSAGEQVKHWFNIKSEQDPYRIDFEERAYKSALMFLPTRIQFPSGRCRSLPYDHQPLTFTENHQSRLLQEQMASLRMKKPLYEWGVAQIGRAVEDHLQRRVSHIKEEDILRTVGALSHLGIPSAPIAARDKTVWIPSSGSVPSRSTSARSRSRRSPPVSAIRSCSERIRRAPLCSASGTRPISFRRKLLT